MDEQTATAIRELNGIILTLNDSIKKLLKGYVELKSRIEELENQQKQK